ncbi:MAG: hypothetical protein V3T05_07715 [Myxococcota bacterium]
MTDAELITRAILVAESEGWRFIGPFDVRKEKHAFFGCWEWRVVGRGPTEEHRSWVRIDAETGEVIATGWRLEQAVAPDQQARAA